MHLYLTILLPLTLLISQTKGAHIEVFLMGGQSNMNGRADASELPTSLQNTQSDVDLYWHRTQASSNVGHVTEDVWTSLAPGTGHGTSSTVYAKEFGPEVTFGRTLADANLAKNIGLIKYSHGGTNLYSDWASGGTYYNTFIDTVTLGLQAITARGDTYTIQGMLWQQGESDTGAESSQYQTNLTSLVSRIRADVGVNNLPFVIGGLSDSQSSSVNTIGSGYYNVRQAQEAVAMNDSNVYFLDTDGFEVRPGDAIHFGVDGQQDIGTGAAELLKFTVVPEPSSTALIGLGALALILRRGRAL
jgi:hypothetical protein